MTADDRGLAALALALDSYRLIRNALKGARGLAADSDELDLEAELTSAIDILDGLRDSGRFSPDGGLVNVPDLGDVELRSGASPDTTPRRFSPDGGLDAAALWDRHLARAALIEADPKRRQHHEETAEGWSAWPCVPASLVIEVGWDADHALATPKEKQG